jgi:hypothetical protein
MKYRKSKRRIQGGSDSTETLPLPQYRPKKDSIVTTGDASDFDGFLALPLYYKAALLHKCDVYFVMNYPAYLLPKKSPSHKQDKDDVDNLGLGLGYGYDLADLINYHDSLAVTQPGNPRVQDWNKVKKKCGNGIISPEKHIEIFDELSLKIIKQIWDWCGIHFPAATSDDRPKINYVRGGINSFNPFQKSAIKLEIAVYCDVLAKIEKPYDIGISNTNFAFRFENIHPESKTYMDMNGSMAWFSEFSEVQKNALLKSVEKCFVMGGVIDNSVVNTKGSLKNILNRFSSSTMNQLYHTEATYDFFTKISPSKLVFITNNEINARFSFLPTSTHDLYDHFEKEMSSRKLIPIDKENNITKLFKAFYESRPNDRKPFDVIPALYMCDYMKQTTKPTYVGGNLFFSQKYGCTILTNTGVPHPTFEFIRNENKIGSTAPGFGKNELVEESKIYNTELFAEIKGIKIAAINIGYSQKLFTDYLHHNTINLVKTKTFPVYDTPTKLPEQQVGGWDNRNKVAVRKESLLGKRRLIYKLKGMGNALFVDIGGIPRRYTEMKKLKSKKN